VAKFARRLSFFFYVHMDLFEEASKFRAGRRLWAKLLRERYGVTDEKALHFRSAWCAAAPRWSPRSPTNNIMRVAIENIARWLGGAQSIFTCAYDEAFQIPTETSAEIALRTQQIVQHESGIAATVDPLGGSYYVEWLTDRMEEGMREVMREIDRLRRVGEGDRGRLAAAAHRRARQGEEGRHRPRRARGRGAEPLPARSAGRQLRRTRMAT